VAQPYVIIQTNGSDQADEWIRLGVEAQVAGKFADAERHYRHALRLDPRSAVATQNLAITFAQLGNTHEGILAIERATIFDDSHAVIQVNRAFMNLEADRIEEALAAAKYAVSISKDDDIYGYINSRLALAMISATAGYPENAVPLYRDILAKDPKHPIANANCAFVQTLTSATPVELLAQRKLWYENNRYPGPKQAHANDKTPDRPIKVGYVGGDFKRHSASMIFGSVVLNHDKGDVVTYLYSTLPVDPKLDSVTQQFQTAVGENWRDISALSDEAADELIRKDGIDILVDLAAHTNGGRLTLFTRKPAPIQVTAWGFAHGTGVPDIDVFLADPIAVREDERRYYAERVVDLPCIVSYQPPVEYNIKGTSAMPYFQNDYITFGSMARYEKLSDACLAAIVEIMKRVPNSRVHFKDHSLRRPYAIKRIVQAMKEIDKSRLMFSISTSHPDHLQCIQSCDLMLDTWPHGGGVVTLEALWMGVPICTLNGTQPSCRTASSVLTLMGHADWIAITPDDYVKVAVKMANDIAMLNKARRTLRQELLDSPIVKGYREATEAVYRKLWKEYCAK